jgi:hypothetical protein
MEDDAPRKPSPRSESARPAKRPTPPAALFMEPTVPSARRPPEPPSRPTQPAAEPAPTRPDEPPAARKATPAKKAAPAKAAPGKKAAPAKKAPVKKAAPEPPEDISPPAPAKRATPAKKAATTVSATARTAAVKKTVPVKKAVAKKVPAKKAAPAKAAAPVIPVTPAPPVPPSWTRLPATPEAVPEWLAHVAVEHFGDQADRYVRWLRDTYPNATPDGLARAAVERLARRGWFTALAGPVGLAALLSAEAALVLHVAAAYGQDPRDPARVPELLALIEPKAAGTVLLGRAAGRLLPGAGALVGLMAGRGALDRVAHRAIAYYRQR